MHDHDLDPIYKLTTIAHCIWCVDFNGVFTQRGHN